MISIFVEKNYKQDFKTKSSINDIHKWERNYKEDFKTKLEKEP